MAQLPDELDQSARSCLEWLGVEQLTADVHCETREFQLRVGGDSLCGFYHLVGRNSELRRRHACPGVGVRVDRDIGIDPDPDPYPGTPLLASDRGESIELLERLEVDL